MKTTFVRLLAFFLLFGHGAGARNFFTRCSGRARNFLTRCSGRMRWSGGCRHVFTGSVLLTHSWCKDG